MVDITNLFLITLCNIRISLNLVIKIIILIIIVEDITLTNQGGLTPMIFLLRRVTNNNKAASVHPRIRRRADDFTVVLKFIKYFSLVLVLNMIFQGAYG